MSDSQSNSQWVGRFAPTPSGALHFGSLVAALGSYLIARHQGGKWLVRIEDLDPPREVAGAADEILRTLQAFGFEWDETVVYQSQRHFLYQQLLHRLTATKATYPCYCSRKQILKRNSGIYDGHCRNQLDEQNAEHAIRLKFNQNFAGFYDQIFGDCQFLDAVDLQDFVVRRRDGLFAYQLAVVADDIQQGVNHVARGADILDSTPRQNFIYHCVGVETPQYFHLPLVVDAKGEKLSKQKLSSALSVERVNQHLVAALNHLGQQAPQELCTTSAKEILAWGIKNWRLENVGKKSRVWIKD